MPSATSALLIGGQVSALRASMTSTWLVSPPNVEVPFSDTIGDDEIAALAA